MSTTPNQSIFRAGWTERIIFQLTKDGSAFNISGMTVSLTGADGSGASLAFTGTVGIQDAATSKVYFDPGPNDLDASKSPYNLRWSVTDSDDKTAWFPRTAPMNWVIQNP